MRSHNLTPLHVSGERICVGTESGEVIVIAHKPREDPSGEGEGSHSRPSSSEDTWEISLRKRVGD